MNNTTRIGRFLQFHEFFSLMALFWILECYMQEELLLLRLLLLCPKAVLRSISLSDLGLGLLSPTFYLSTGYSKWICCFHKELYWPCTYLVSGIFPSYLCWKQVVLYILTILSNPSWKLCTLGWATIFKGSSIFIWLV